MVQGQEHLGSYIPAGACQAVLFHSHSARSEPFAQKAIPIRLKKQEPRGARARWARPRFAV
jgi:hypothetical protein